MAWDVFSDSETAKGEKVKSISRFSWKDQPGYGEQNGTPFVFTQPAAPPPQPGPPPDVYGTPLGYANGIAPPMATPMALPAAGGLLSLGVQGLGAGIGSYLATQQSNGQGSLPYVPGSQYGVPFGGPGLAEPGGKYLLKEWHIRMDSKDGDFDLQFYLTINERGTKRIFMYNQRTKAWKTWPMPRLAVIGKNMPSHQMITRLRRNLKRHKDDANTILKLVDPTGYAKRLGYRKYSRRR